MSGATGAGPAKTGANGARGPAADSQGGTVTDTRGPKSSVGTDAGQDKPAQPYHPPQAYPAPSGPGTAQGAAGAAGAAGAGAQRKPRAGVRTAPRTRKARLRVAKADPWSVMKVSFLLSIALGICTIVAAAVLWMVMDAMGVFSTVGGTISEATGSNEGNGFDLQSFLSLPRVLIFTSVIAVIDVVLATALATLGAFIYNLSAGFVGGVELTLAEDE
ncbi:DUF3566 domain-containing protein [Streptomyces sp. NBC_00853]|uniref:DUF3566 domain-containing protein n=1 Tax=Streptomyces sp. NBC_00853 TaxID=2903681 RepID=UPI003872DC19|nr:DUF3566 domain-containing protein [Streptomyces sp. NBC_00853]